MSAIGDTPAYRGLLRVVRRSVGRSRINAYTDHRDLCEVCTDDKHCPKGQDLADAMAEYLPQEGA